MTEDPSEAVEDTTAGSGDPGEIRPEHINAFVTGRRTASPPKRKRRLRRWLLYLGGVVGLFVVLIVIAALFGGSPSPNATTKQKLWLHPPGPMAMPKTSPVLRAQYRAITWPALWPIHVRTTPDGHAGSLTAWYMVACPDRGKEGCFTGAYFYDGLRYVGQNHDDGKLLALSVGSSGTFHLSTRRWRKHDAECCPRGARYVARYNWNGSKLMRSGPYPNPRDYLPRPHALPMGLHVPVSLVATPGDKYVAGILPVLHGVVVGNSSVAASSSAAALVTAQTRLNRGIQTFQAALANLHAVPDPPFLAGVDAKLNEGVNGLINGATTMQQGEETGNGTTLSQGRSAYRAGMAALRAATRMLTGKGYVLSPPTVLALPSHVISPPTTVPTATSPAASPPSDPFRKLAKQAYYAGNDANSAVSVAFGIGNSNSTSPQNIVAMQNAVAELQRNLNQVQAFSAPPGDARLQQDVEDMLINYIDGTNKIILGFQNNDGSTIDAGNSIFQQGQAAQSKVLSAVWPNSAS